MEQTILFINDTVAPESTESHRLRPYSLFNSDTREKRPVTMVASVGLNNELGRDGDLCWHIPEDLRHFKELTMGGAVIMGRSTWESLPKRPLPGRTNIVVTRNPDFDAPEAIRAESIENAIQLAGNSEIFIIGGESIYRQAMPFATRLELTRIFASDPEADKFFPEISETEWKTTVSSEKIQSRNGIEFRYETVLRRPLPTPPRQGRE